MVSNRSSSSDSYNPYAAPCAESRGQGSGEPRLPGERIAVMFGAVVASDVLMRLLLVLRTGALGGLEAGIALFTGTARWFLDAAWLYSAWRSIPPTHRGTLSPRRAVVSFLMPIYNVYWVFAVYVTLCDTLNRILARTGSPSRAPRGLGLLASSVGLGSGLASWAFLYLPRFHPYQSPAFHVLSDLITGGLWLAFMVECNRALAEVVRLGDDVPKIDPVDLSSLQRSRGFGLLRVIATWMAILWGIACWQFLNPPPSHRRSAPSESR